MTVLALLSVAEQKQLSNKLSDIPPSSLLAQSRLGGGTLDQQQHLLGLRHRALNLAESFRLYFQGEAHDLPGLSPLDQELALKERNYWLRFYSLIQHAWNDISALLELEGISFAQENITSPGQALIIAIEQRFMLRTWPAFAKYYRWTPSQSRKRLKSFRDLASGALDNKLQVKKRAESDLERLNSQMNEFTIVESLCIAACRELVSPKKKSANRDEIRRNLRELDRADADIQSFYDKNFLRERKKTLGHEWINGKKSIMSQHGGKSLKNP